MCSANTLIVKHNSYLCLDNLRCTNTIGSGRHKFGNYDSIFILPSRTIIEFNEILEEEDVDKKVQILYKINSLLPEPYRINIPSLITNDYVDIALYRIEENIHGITACTSR
jgi:predicted DNA-binding protein (UPF0278 family)